jgi:hypothetical protein
MLQSRRVGRRTGVIMLHPSHLEVIVGLATIIPEYTTNYRKLPYMASLPITTISPSSKIV